MFEILEMAGQVEDVEPTVQQYIPILLVTANVGSLFEDLDNLLAKWIQEFIQKVVSSQPLFLALHLQELGGKTYEKSSNQINNFLRSIVENEAFKNFTSHHIFLDEDFETNESFTALGNIYFIHQKIARNVYIWNFNKMNWQTVSSKMIYNKNLMSVSTIEKAKFPQNFFPECKWSRKGFMRSRWNIRGTVVDLINIHLFHDASNILACESFPSVYTKFRRNALKYTLERFHSESKHSIIPFFIFGDFNFRCDSKGVLNKFSENMHVYRFENTKKDTTIIIKNEDNTEVLRIGKKEFKHANHQSIFKEQWLRCFDREIEAFKDILFEFKIVFPPSYPFEENVNFPFSYMTTRCPSWCDRILFSSEAKNKIFDGSEGGIEYNMIGENVCMGDHKPIFLQFNLKPDQGVALSTSTDFESKWKIVSGNVHEEYDVEDICAKTQYVKINSFDKNMAQKWESESCHSDTGFNIFKETAI